MRSMKTTSLAFGPLVNVPVKMFKATDDGRAGEVDFHQHHASCVQTEKLGRIRYARTCESCGEVVNYNDIVKGTTRDDMLIVVTDDELESLEVQVGPQIEIEQFCGVEEIDPIFFEASYYLEPDGRDDGYAALRQLLVEDELVGVVRFVMRTKVHMGVLRVLGNALIIHTMLWFDQIRSAKGLKGLDKVVEVDPKVMEVARVLAGSMTKEFDPTAFSDGFSEKLIELVDAKAAGAVIHVEPSHDLDAPTDVNDLLAKLQASVATKAAPKKPAPKRRRSA